MKSSLLLALSLAPLACAAAEPAPAAPPQPVAPPVVVDLAAPSPPAPKAEPPKAQPAADPKPVGNPEAGARDVEQHGLIGLLHANPNNPQAPWGSDDALLNNPLVAKGNMWGGDIGRLVRSGRARARGHRLWRRPGRGHRAR